MMDKELTAEEIQRKYNAALDSVNLLNGDKPDDTSEEDWADTIDRNVRHLKIMVAKDFWAQEHDLTPLHDAISNNL